MLLRRYDFDQVSKVKKAAATSGQAEMKSLEVVERNHMG